MKRKRDHKGGAIKENGKKRKKNIGREEDRLKNITHDNKTNNNNNKNSYDDNNDSEDKIHSNCSSDKLMKALTFLRKYCGHIRRLDLSRQDNIMVHHIKALSHPSWNLVTLILPRQHLIMKETDRDNQSMIIQWPSSLRRLEISELANLEDDTLFMKSLSSSSSLSLSSPPSSTPSSLALSSSSTIPEITHFKLTAPLHRGVETLFNHMLPFLQYLFLSDCYHLQDEHLKQLPNTLICLDLFNCINITNVGVKTITSCCPKLKHLSLASCSTNVEVIPELPAQLETLSMPYERLQDENIALLPSSLKWLNIWGCELVTNRGLKMLPRSLQTLYIACCRYLTDSGLQYLPPNLEHLVFYHYQNVTLAGFEKYLENSEVKLDKLDIGIDPNGKKYAQYPRLNSVLVKEGKVLFPFKL
jgi:hypothetical protein